MAPSSSRNGAKVIWIVVHTAEGIRDVDDLKAFFDRSTNASSHAGADDEKLLEGWVPYDRAAWTLRNGNAYSDNLELCGFAKWSREEWLNNHMGMVNNAALWIRRRCQARGIPMVKLSAQDVDFERPGVIGHHDYTQGTGDGTHWDPGPGFPWDVVMAKARGDVDMQADERSWLADLHMTVVSGARRDKQLNKDLAYIVSNIVSLAGEVATRNKMELVEAKVDALSSRLDQLQVSGVDVQALAEALRLLLPTAKDVADELRRRLES